MNNPIFRRLQEAVEHPCRSKDWFGLAEQAINTIYALGEHPDILCNDMIRNLTIKAFRPRPRSEDPDAMDQDKPPEDPDNTMIQDTVSSQGTASVAPPSSKDLGDAFE